MRQTEEKARAKLNLSLDVLGRMPDGYHEMRMVMQSISLHDQVGIELTDDGAVSVRSNFRFLPVDGRNLAARAAEVFLSAAEVKGAGCRLTLRKRIPVGAGMAGGSTDAAAVLRGLNRLTGTPFTADQLEELARGIGSDVAFCVRGGTQLATGRGDVLRPLAPLPDCHVVVCKPRFSISTPALFQQIDSRRSALHPDTDGPLAALEQGDLTGVARRMYNVFEDVLPRQYDAVSAIKAELLDGGAIGAIMTGTGSAVFGLFARESDAARVRASLRERYRDCFCTTPASFCME